MGKLFADSLFHFGYIALGNFIKDTGGSICYSFTILIEERINNVEYFGSILAQGAYLTPVFFYLFSSHIGGNKCIHYTIAKDSTALSSSKSFFQPGL